MRAVDRVIDNASEIVTCAGFSNGPARGGDQARLGIVRDGAIAIAKGRFVDVGPRDRVLRENVAPKNGVIDAKRGVVLPGFVDPHTHLIFAGDRASEWEQRMQGKPYLEILREGGGILRTVTATRAALHDELLENAKRWAAIAIAHGTTTIEIKSGYCLDREGELKLLSVARALGESIPIATVRTFLGAHVVPSEHKNDREAYLTLVEETQAEAARQGLAEIADVFCEAEAFTLAETERLLTHAKAHGLAVKVHAEQFTASGATALAARLGAVSVDHLEHLEADDLRALGAMERPPVAVLLPGVSFHLGMDRHANARALIDASVPVALATDMNPGSSCTPSMPMIVQLACRALRMTVAEAIVASTINAAHAIRRGAETGSIEVGKRADVIVCDIPDHRWLGYAFGINPVARVIANGVIVR